LEDDDDDDKNEARKETFGDGYEILACSPNDEGLEAP
jgi:hypothetical protein